MIRKHRILMANIMILLVFTAYVIMDTFFITRVYGDGTEAVEETSVREQSDDGDAVSDREQNDEKSASDPAGAVITEDSYSDGNISVTLTEYRQNDTTIYAADVRLSSPEYLRTALAEGTYGRNITQATSEMAENAGAVLAVNGDYYGAQQKGYVIRNGVLYRDTGESGQEDLVIYSDGSMEVIDEGEVSAQELIGSGAQQTLSFGPALVEDGSITVSEGDEVGKSMSSNPRTAIGYVSKDHFVLVVSDGRTDESEGLSLKELAEVMADAGCVCAYNLDGGGSTTMYYKGEVYNNPTTNGRIKERKVSDIVYIK